MKPEAARRASFLIKALEDLRFEIDPPEDAAKDAADWKNDNPKPLRLERPERKLELQIVDNDGGMHCLAKLEVSMIIRAVRTIIDEVESELKALGIELE